MCRIYITPMLQNKRAPLVSARKATFSRLLFWLINNTANVAILQVIFLGDSDISVHTEASGGETLTSAGVSGTLQIFSSIQTVAVMYVASFLLCSLK